MFEIPFNTAECPDSFYQICSNDELFYAIDALNIVTDPFHFFDLNLSAEQKLFLSQVNIIEEKDFVLDISKLYSSQLDQAFMSDLLKNMIQCRSLNDQNNCVSNFLDVILDKTEYLSHYVDLNKAKVLILTAKKSENLEDYRWHRDTSEFQVSYNLTNPSYSFIFNLIGEDTTSFYLPTKVEYADFKKYSENKLSEKAELADFFPNEKFHPSRISSPNFGQAAVFFASNIEGTIHSTPKSYNDRFVVGIFTQTKPS